MIDGQSHPTTMYVGNVAVGAAATVTAMPNKSVAIVDLTGAVLSTAAAATTRIRIACKDSLGNVTYSPVFTVGTLMAKTYQAYSAPVSQVTYVGYNPNTSAGSIPVTSLLDYSLSLELFQTSGIYNNSAIIKQVAINSGASASQYGIVGGLAQAWYSMMLVEPTPVATVEVVSDGTRTAFTPGAGTATAVNFIQGSNLLSYSIGVGGASGTLATPITSGTVKILGVVYGVTGGTATTLTLDRPYVGASGGVLFTDANTGTYASISNYGLKITGINYAPSNPQTQDYYRCSFFTRLKTPALGVFGDSGATITVGTTPSEGIGTGYKLAQKEYRMQFTQKDITISQFPTTKFKQEVVATNTYDQIVIMNSDQTYVSPATGINPASTQVMIVPVLNSLTTDIANIKTVLGIS